MRENLYYLFNVKDIDMSKADAYLDPKILKRIFEARESSIENAIPLYEKYLEWLLIIRPDTYDVTEIIPTLNKGKVFMHGQDRSGRYCMLGFPRNHIPGECPLENTFRLQWYWMSKLFPLIDQ